MELTLSARKCKYCNTSLISRSEKSLKLCKNIILILAITSIVIFLFIKLFKSILLISKHKLSNSLFDVLFLLLVKSGVGPIIGTIFLSTIFILIFSSFWGDIKKEFTNIIQDISDGLANVSQEELLTKIKEDKKQKEIARKEKEQNISKVVQQNGTFYIYNELGRLMHTTSHPFGVLTGYTSSSYTIKGNDGWTYVYDREGHRTAY